MHTNVLWHFISANITILLLLILPLVLLGGFILLTLFEILRFPGGKIDGLVQSPSARFKVAGLMASLILASLLTFDALH